MASVVAHIILQILIVRLLISSGSDTVHGDAAILKSVYARK